MQQRLGRSNRDRSETTRLALIQAAKGLFIDKGYAATSTPQIVATAGITRGALYHHFEDKQDLFRAVLEQEAACVAEEIEAATPADLPPRKALIEGSMAYLDAMTAAGRTRLLLIEGPAVLGSQAMAQLDETHATRTLREGLEAAIASPDAGAMPIAELAVLLSAAFDRAALAIDAGADPAAFRLAMITIIERMVGGA